MKLIKKLAALLIAAAMCMALVPVFAGGEAGSARLTPAEKAERLADLTDFSSRLAGMKRAYGRRTEGEEGAYSTARIIVKSHKKIECREAVAVVSGYNDWHILQFAAPAEAEAACKRFEGMRGVEYAVPDIVMKVSAQPGVNSFRSWGYGPNHLNAYEFNEWLYSLAGDVGVLPDITVAVVDTGADYSHPFIADRLEPGYDVVDGDFTPIDGHSHGTHVAGTIVDGTFENVRIMPIRVLNDNGYGDTSGVAIGMEYGYLHGCSVENLSLGGSCDGLTGHEHLMMADVIESAFDNGTVICVAAGNDSEDASNSCPANVARACTVASIGQSHSLSYFSNYGDLVDVSAPGESISSSVPGGGYDYKSGTSMATPHVSAAAAMVMSAVPGIGADDVVNVLKNTAVRLSASGSGAGMVRLSADMFPLDPAVNAEGRRLHFSSTGNYPWTAGDGFAVSGNAGVNSSSSQLTCAVDVGAEQTVTFEYKVSSEEGHDHLRLICDSAVLFEASGERDWQSVTAQIPGTGTKTLVWQYSKDASGAAGSDRAYIRNVRLNGSLITAVNYTGASIPVYSEGEHPWVADEHETAARSGNAGVNNSESVMRVSLPLNYGMKAVFGYKVSAGAGDVFTVKANGETVLTSSSTDGYVGFEYTAAFTGVHELEFIFTKDGSGAAGSDCAWVRRLTYYHTFESAVNGSHDFLPIFNEGEYPWLVEGDHVKSSNADMDSTESSFTLMLNMRQGETLSFRYYVSSEEFYDFFRFTADGTELISESGNGYWKTYTFTASASKTYSFKWSFEKDYSLGSYDDCARVDDIVYSGSVISADGDANADGVIDSVDALLILRYSMGLVGENALDLARCDVNGDGVVDSADAIIVLRRTLGM